MNARKWHQSKICIVINDKSQCSIAKNLRNDELLYYTFIIHSAGEIFFLTLDNIWQSYRQMVDCVIHPIRLALLSLKMQISPDKLNNFCITQKLLSSVAMLIGRLV